MMMIRQRQPRQLSARHFVAGSSKRCFAIVVSGDIIVVIIIIITSITGVQFAFNSIIGIVRLLFEFASHSDLYLLNSIKICSGINVVHTGELLPRGSPCLLSQQRSQRFLLSAWSSSKVSFYDYNYCRIKIWYKDNLSLGGPEWPLVLSLPYLKDFVIS